MMGKRCMHFTEQMVHIFERDTTTAHLVGNDQEQEYQFEFKRFSISFQSDIQRFMRASDL